MDALEKAQGIAEQIDWDGGAYPITVHTGMLWAAIAQAEALGRIATHLGNIHQCLMTPDANGEPITIADQLSAVDDESGHTLNVAEILRGIKQRL